MAEAETRSTVITVMDHWQLIPMTDIENMAHYRRVLASIKDVGILHPLIVATVTKEEWEQEKKTTNPDIKDPPDYLDECYRIQCGVTRFYAGLELGKTTFNCIVVDSIEEAKQLCCKARKETKGW